MNQPITLRELTPEEIKMVGGGQAYREEGTGDNNLAFGVATSWASTVGSAAIGFTIAGPAGALIGAGVGLTLGTTANVAYHYSQSSSGGEAPSSGMSGGSNGMITIDRTGGSRILQK